jgi:hypothetical protein
VLTKSAGEPFSSLEHPVRLKASVRYRVEFDVKALLPNAADLVVDLYGGPSYDNPAHNGVVTTFSREYKRVAFEWNSGADAPSSGYLRFVTVSTSPIQVRNISFSEVI